MAQPADAAYEKIVWEFAFDRMVARGLDDTRAGLVIADGSSHSFTPDAWIDESKTKIGYEISFTRHFYKPQPLRTLAEIRTDILAVQKEAEGVLDELLKGGTEP